MKVSTVSIRCVLKRQKLLFNFLFFKTGNHCNVPVFPLKKIATAGHNILSLNRHFHQNYKYF